jgi:hypothetical protein
MGSAGPQGAAKRVPEIVEVFKVFFNRTNKTQLLKRQTDMHCSF